MKAKRSRHSNLAILADEASRHPLLSAEREGELSRIILADADADAVKAAIDELVSSNIRLVIYWVTRKMRRDSRFPAEDLVAAGLPGLFVAAKRFDASRHRFSTYAIYWIRHHILTYIAQEDPRRACWVPRYLASEAKKVANSESPGLSSGLASRIAAAGRSVRAFNPTTDSRCYHEDVSEEAKEEEATKEEMVAKLLEAAEPRERQAIRFYFGLEPLPSREKPTLKAIGREFGVTRECIRKRIEAGFERARTYARATGCF